MTIQHLVIGGGGPFGLTAFGALKHLHDNKFWDIKNIKTIYATSIGTLVGLYISLGYDYDYIYDYLVKRPWEKLFKDVDIENLFNLYDEKGLIDIYPSYLKKFNILLDAKGLSPSITLKEYYEYTGIDFNIIVSELNCFSMVILSHKTHPDLELLMAITMSSAFPIIFKPVIVEDKCYIDGGVFSNYAVNICLKNTDCQKDEILGVKKMTFSDNDNYKITKESSIIDYLEKIVIKSMETISDEKHLENIPFEIDCDMTKYSNYEGWINVALSSDHRAELINYGIECSKTFYESFLEKKQEFTEDDITHDESNP
jgi:NTE family protein